MAESRPTLASRLDKIEPSPTIAITSLARKLKSEGKDVIGFGAGEPDFGTPGHIIEAAKKALDDGVTRYTDIPGIGSVRKAISAFYKREYGLDFEPEDTIISAGGKHVLYNLFMSMLNPGDEVIVPAPYWVSYKDITVLAEGEPVVIQTTFEEGFKMGPEKLEKAIGPKTRAVILNSPSNPTGVVYSADELKAFAEILRKHPQVWIVTDDIYEKIIFGSNSFINIAMVAPDLIDRVVIVSGVSKTYAMTGWRIGYAVARDRDLIKAMSKLQGQSTTNATSFAQMGAEAALTGDQAVVAEMGKAFEQRGNYIYDALKKTPGLRVVKPGGAFYIFPDFSQLIQSKGFQDLKKAGDEQSDSKVFSSALLEKELVAVVPGVAFGYDAGFRISFALSMEQIEKGVARIDSFARQLIG